jgi:hypothetical protein
MREGRLVVQKNWTDLSMNLCLNQLKYTLASYWFVPPVFGEHIPTAEFGMISAETACRDIEKNSKIFNEDFYLPLHLPLWLW